MVNAIKITDPYLINQAYGTITNMETVSHTSDIFCVLRSHQIAPDFTVAENTCFAFSGKLEPKTGLLLNFSEQDTHYFNGTISSSKNHDLNVTVSRPGRESHFSFLSPYHALFINVDEQRFKNLFQELTFLDYDQFFAYDFVQFIDHAEKRNIASRIKNMLKHEIHDNTFLEDLIVSIDHTPTPNQRNFCNNLAIRAHQILTDHKTTPLTLTDLTQMLHAPARSIQQGFKAVYGRGPIDYHTRYRMQCVRQFLKSHSIGHGDLTQVIYQFGFTHQGRFAQYYRKLFGILPSKESRYNR